MTHMTAGFSPATRVDSMDRSIRAALGTGLILRTAGAGHYAGSHVDVDGHLMANFAGCSYLGLEQREELREAAIDAIRRYGTQLSISRAYLQSPLYAELEDALSRITGGSALVTASTSAAHISALPVLVGERDVILIDKLAHSSLHTAVALAHHSRVLTFPHGRLDVLERHVSTYSRNHERVWCVIDGIHSMSGAFAPFEALTRLLVRYPSLHLYVDDAHATSWCGRFGRGRALDVFPDVSRVVVALSLNKAFAAAGGLLVFPTATLRDRVRCCGGPMVFSGPSQPPMLGAAVASARLHLAPGFAALQSLLHDRIALARGLAAELDVPLTAASPTPILNLRTGSAQRAFALTRRLWDRGFFVSPSAPPAVPPEQSGVRVTLSVLNALDDVKRLITTIADEVHADPGAAVA